MGDMYFAAANGLMEGLRNGSTNRPGAPTKTQVRQHFPKAQNRGNKPGTNGHAPTPTTKTWKMEMEKLIQTTMGRARFFPFLLNFASQKDGTFYQRPNANALSCLAPPATFFSASLSFFLASLGMD